MLEFPRWRRIWLWAITLICAALAIPSLVIHSGGAWPSALPAPQVNLGLDLAGGSRILLEADTRQVARQRLEAMEESVRAALRPKRRRIRYQALRSSMSAGEMVMRNGV